MCSLSAGDFIVRKPYVYQVRISTSSAVPQAPVKWANCVLVGPDPRMKPIGYKQVEVETQTTSRPM